MAKKRKVEIFTAGCVCCEEAVELVKNIACDSCELEVLDMRQDSTVQRARELGVSRVPSVAIDGMLAECCKGGISEQTLRAAGVGSCC